MIDNFNHTESQPFYNTIQLSDADWKLENDKAKSLQNIIWQIFENNSGLEISGWQLRDYLEGRMGTKVNINSVRRCLSNLKNDFKLHKTGKMRIGNEGKQEHFYASNEALITPQNDYLKDNQPSTADLAINLIKTTDKIQIQFEFD